MLLWIVRKVLPPASVTESIEDAVEILTGASRKNTSAQIRRDDESTSLSYSGQRFRNVEILMRPAEVCQNPESEGDIVRPDSLAIITIM